MAAARGQKLKLAAAIGLPLVLAVTLIALAVRGDDGADGAAPTTTTTARPATPEARAWQTRVDDILLVFARDHLSPLLQAANEWSARKSDGQAFTGRLNLFLPEAVKVRNAVGALSPLEEAPLAQDLYHQSIGLYVEIGRVYQVALDLADEPLRGQLDLVARRLRSLADKLYDQGRALVDPKSLDPTDPGDGAVDVRRGPEVPEWVSEGLAAGPPLGGEAPPPPDVPTQHEVVRPQEPEKDWLERVNKLDLPSSGELSDAIEAADTQRLARVQAAPGGHPGRHRVLTAPDVGDGQSHHGVDRARISRCQSS